MGKRLTAERWFGPLEDRLEILESTLLFIDDESPSESELHAWISNETNASDEENIGRQIGFLRTIELLKTIDGQYALTDRAHEYLDTENTDVLFVGLTSNVAGFDNVLSELYAGPKDLEEITSILQNQSAFSGGSGVAERHIEWLQVLGYVVELEEKRYKLTTTGEQVKENMNQNFHIDDYVQRQLEAYKESQDRQQRLEQAQSIASLVQDLVTELIKEYPTRIDSEALSILRRLTQADPKVSTKKDRVADLELPEDTITEFQSRIIDAGLVGGGQADIPMPESHEDDAYEFLNTVLNSEDPETLDEAVEDFAELDINGVKTGVLSPILYCLKPSYFPILNNGSIDAVAEHFDIGVSNNLSEYPANASTFRRLQSEVGLGGANGDLRDIDWFLYTLKEEEAEKTQQQLFKVPLATGGMKEGYNRTVLEPVSTETLEAHVETTFDRETIPLWGTRTEIDAVEPGDWLLFGDRETDSYIAAGQVSSYGAEKVSEDNAEAIRDAVGWSDEGTYPGLIYLDTLHQFEVPAETVWEILDYADFTYSGFQKVGESTLEDHIIDNPEFGSVEAFIEYLLDSEPTAEAYLFGIPSNQFGSSESLKPSYRITESSPLFNTLTPKTTIVGIDTDGVLRAVGTSITVEADETAIGESKSSQGESPSTDREIEWIYILSSEDGIPLSELDTDLTHPSEGAVNALEADTIDSIREEIREAFLEAHQTKPYEIHDTETLKRLLEAKQQLVFYGPPGTGKTYTATRFAEWLRANRDRNVAGVKGRV